MLKRSRKIQIHLSNSLNQKLNQAAKRSGVTKSAFVRVALEREFALERQLDRECALKVKESKSGEGEKKYQMRLFKD